jgi:hypothetical protein
MSKHKNNYLSDIIFIGNGDMIERASRIIRNTTHEYKKTYAQSTERTSQLPVVSPWDAREIINKMMINYEKPWSEGDIYLLKQLKKSRRKRSEMAKILGRTPLAVKAKIEREGLSRNKHR